MKNALYTFFLIAPLALSILASNATAAKNGAIALEGDYRVVAMRRASDVTGPAVDESVAANIGDIVSFGPLLKWLDGAECDDWRLSEAVAPVTNLDDPILSDTQIAPIDVERTTGDKRLNQHLTISCDGSALASFTQVDARVLITSSPSGMTYVVLERDLNAGDILAFQIQLKDMKFYEGDPAENWSENSLRAVAAYAEYRGANYRFQRTAITRNLLDGLVFP